MNLSKDEWYSPDKLDTAMCNCGQRHWNSGGDTEHLLAQKSLQLETSGYAATLPWVNYIALVGTHTLKSLYSRPMNLCDCFEIYTKWNFFIINIAGIEIFLNL